MKIKGTIRFELSGRLTFTPEGSAECWELAIESGAFADIKLGECKEVELLID